MCVFIKLHITAQSGLCVRVFVAIPFILDVGFLDVSAGVTQEEDQTGLFHLHFAVLALSTLALT